MKLIWLLLAAFFLILTVACGGDDDDSSADSSSDSPAASEDSSAPESSDDEGSGDDESAEDEGSSDEGGASSSNLAPKTAVVTVGDQTFEFDMSLNCQTLFGAVAGSGRAANGDDISLNITIVPEDIDTSSIHIDDDREDRPVQYDADVEIMETFPVIEPGQSQVDEFVIDGPVASGTATFIDTFAVILAGGGTVDFPEPVQGSFEINCGE